jgi:hypothetical protein
MENNRRKKWQSLTANQKEAIITNFDRVLTSRARTSASTKVTKPRIDPWYTKHKDILPAEWRKHMNGCAMVFSYDMRRELMVFLRERHHHLYRELIDGTPSLYAPPQMFLPSNANARKNTNFWATNMNEGKEHVSSTSGLRAFIRAPGVMLYSNADLRAFYRYIMHANTSLSPTCAPRLNMYGGPKKRNRSPSPPAGPAWRKRAPASRTRGFSGTI